MDGRIQLCYTPGLADATPTIASTAATEKILENIAIGDRNGVYAIAFYGARKLSGLASETSFQLRRACLTVLVRSITSILKILGCGRWERIVSTMLQSNDHLQ